MDLSVFGQGINLVSSTVSQDREGPAVEAVKTACLLKEFHSWTKVQMVGITQNNFSSDVVLQFTLMNGLDRSCRSNRHKNRSGDIAMARADYPGAGFGVRIERAEREFHLAAKIATDLWLYSLTILSLCRLIFKSRNFAVVDPSLRCFPGYSNHLFKPVPLCLPEQKNIPRTSSPARFGDYLRSEL